MRNVNFIYDDSSMEVVSGRKPFGNRVLHRMKTGFQCWSAGEKVSQVLALPSWLLGWERAMCWALLSLFCRRLHPKWITIYSYLFNEKHGKEGVAFNLLKRKHIGFGSLPVRHQVATTEAICRWVSFDSSPPSWLQLVLMQMGTRMQSLGTAVARNLSMEVFRGFF